MIKELFFEGKTIDDAVVKAAAQLGQDKDFLEYEVVTMPVKGLFGLGAVNAKIKIEKEVPDEPEAATAEAEQAPAEDAFVEKIAKRDHPESVPPRAERPERSERPERRERSSRGRRDRRGDRAPKAPLVLPDPAPEIEDEVSAALIEFLKGTTDAMGLSDAEIRVGSREADSYEATVSGSKMGVLIGRRGESLDAVQYLAGLFVNRKLDKKVKVTVDTENYRAKRVAALEDLAEKTADKAARYRKNITLEPMSPYERRVIHAKLTGRANITTFSVGSEPRRKVVVSYTEEAVEAAPAEPTEE